MSEIVIKKYADFSRELILPGLSEIFFESSSKKEFKDQKERDQFFYKYLGFYLEHFPEHTFIAWGEGVLGYITGAPVSDTAELQNLQPHLEVFKDLFDKYPAHLHINMHHRSRGLGLGSKLLIEFEKGLGSLHNSGCHLMTSPSSRNRSFYSKNGYDFELERPYLGNPILFMGKAL